jgi:hypothetical protein
LVPASPQHGDWFQIRKEVNEHFGSSFHQLDSRLTHDIDHHLVDTRRGAWLVSKERGSLGAGKDRAMVRAQLILGTWTLLKPPHNEMYMPLWPVASEWLPQPHFHVAQRTVSLENGEGERNSTVIYDDDK